MKKLNSAVLIILLVSLTSCLQMLDEAAKSLDNASEQSSESLSDSSYNTITVDSLYTLDVPKYMKQMNNLHPDASLRYANIYKEAYTVVIHESKEEFISIFKEIEEYDDEISPVENYTIVQKKMFKETIDNLKVQDYGLVQINNYPARQIKISGTVDGLKIIYLIAFVEGADNIYMIMNWTLRDRFNKFENTFEYINGTFKLIKANEVS